MLLNLSPSSQIFLANLSRMQGAIGKAQQQVSSGYKVQTASDAPDQISLLLQLEANLSSNTQASANLNQIKSSTDSGESAINSAVLLAQQVAGFGAQGASSLNTAQERTVLAQQVESVQQQLVSIANTTAGGRYVFSGDADTAPSYQLNLANPNGVDRLVSTQATRQAEDANGQPFAVSKTAQDIFDHRNSDDTLASDNLFAAVNSLRVALTNNDTPGISAALDSLRQASDYVNSQQAFYGAVQERLAGAISSADNAAVSLKTQISSIRDADLAEAALELTAGQSSQQAALAAQGKQSHSSLFDFLG